MRVVSSGRYLQINSAELADGAQYTCVASNIAGQTTRQFNLAVNGTARTQPDSMLTQSGFLEKGFFQMFFTVLDVTDLSVCLSVCLFLSLSLSLSVCLSLSLSVSLYVSLSPVAPTIQDGPLTVSVLVDRSVVLECIVAGVPAPRVTWRKHGAVLAGTNPRSARGAQ